MAIQVVDLYPLLFLIVGLAVLFLRVEDRNAWLLALVFATFISAARIPGEFEAVAPHFRSFLLAYHTILGSLLTGLFYFFFAVFPTRSPIDRKVPWLKWALLVLGLCLSVGGYRYGNSEALPFIVALIGHRVAQNTRIVVVYGAIFLGLISLVWNVFSALQCGRPPQAEGDSLGNRRRGHTGCGAGAGGGSFSCGTFLLAEFRQGDVAVPVSPVLRLCGSEASGAGHPGAAEAQRALFCGGEGLLFPDSAVSIGLTFWFAHAFSRHFSAGSTAAIPVGATFGVLVISGATQVHRRVRTRLDRAFFRSAYDAQLILENLAAQTATVTSREQLARCWRTTSARRCIRKLWPCIWPMMVANFLPMLATASPVARLSRLAPPSSPICAMPRGRLICCPAAVRW